MCFFVMTLLLSCGLDASQPITPTSNAVISSFSATPANVTAGESAEFSALYIIGSGTIDQGVGTITSSTPITVTPDVTTTYTLTVTDNMGISTRPNLQLGLQLDPLY